MKRASYCLQKRTFIKAKSYQNQTTQFSESLDMEYYGEKETPTGRFALYDIEQNFNAHNKIVIVNTDNNSETTIKSKRTIKKWADYTNMLVPPKTIIRCYGEGTNYKGDSYAYLTEYSWVDYAAYRENPMFILQICDYASGKVLEEKVYKTAGRARNRINEYIKTSSVEEDTIVYDGKNCTVILNGIDISEYVINPENVYLSLITSDGWSSKVHYRTTTEGLF